MVRYFLPVLMLLISSVHAGGYGKCSYVPKRTATYMYPEREIYDDCASYENDVLKITEKHLDQIDFGILSTARFFTSGQAFYVKPSGKYLPVIFYENSADSYQEGLTRSLLKGKTAYFNMNFDLVLAPAYDWAWPFKEGKALVCTGCVLTQVEDGHQSVDGGKWGVINKEGKEVVPVRYTKVEISSQY